VPAECALRARPYQHRSGRRRGCGMGGWPLADARCTLVLAAGGRLCAGRFGKPSGGRHV